MNAFVTLDRLSVPVARQKSYASRPAAMPGLVSPRAVLTAQWHVAADGALLCRWLVDDPAPDWPAR